MIGTWTGNSVLTNNRRNKKSHYPVLHSVTQHGSFVLSHQWWNPPMAVLWNLWRNCQILACCVWCLHWQSLASVLHRMHHQTVPCSSCRDFTPLSSGNSSLCSKFWPVSSRIPFCCHWTTLGFSPSPWSSGLLACHWCTADVKGGPYRPPTRRKVVPVLILANQEKPPSVTWL